MSTTAYGVYTNVGGTDTEVTTEDIEDGLRDDELRMRLGQLFDRVAAALPAGSTWVIQATLGWGRVTWICVQASQSRYRDAGKD